MANPDLIERTSTAAAGGEVDQCNTMKTSTMPTGQACNPDDESPAHSILRGRADLRRLPLFVALVPMFIAAFASVLPSPAEGAKPATLARLSAATLLPRPHRIEDFALVDQDGEAFSLESLWGHWTFVAIGYTSCPDICPTTMATFNGVSAAIEQGGGQELPRFLFISVDPERDPPERLAQYVRYFNPAFLGATGDDAELRALATQLGLLYARVDGEDTAMGYLINHSAGIVLLDPQGRLTAVFGAPHDAVRMARDFLTIAADRGPL